jgi:class 3 adenylate cyclase
MPRIPILRLGRTSEDIDPPALSSYFPSLTLEGLQVGVDNLRHDVHLSRGFVEAARLQVARLIVRHGNVEGLLAAEAPEREKPRNNYFIGNPSVKEPVRAEPAELKPLLAELHLEALNRAKASGNLCVDLLARVAMIKFLRVELNAQFNQTLERCRMMLRNYEGVRQGKAFEYRERVAAFQISKKVILRKAGQELFHTLREIERETLARTRRSLFGTRSEAEYRLFLNPLIFSEDGRDTYLNAQHYVMLGNFDRDPDRFSNVRRIACDFLRSLDLGPEAENEATLNGWLNVPDNALELVGDGTSDDSTLQKRSQAARLQAWVDLLEQERLMDYVVASYEVVPLLAEYSPRINPQQLKNALISREERSRVEILIAEHGKLSPQNLHAAIERMANSRTHERGRMAARFLRDFLRYHRDLRRLETMNEALDSANLIGNDKMRELSAMNSTLYEFLLRNERGPAEEKILRHVILKADVRDSSRLTRSLLERGLNPASYFSLNFYDPVNKLLPKYGASKVFLEGDAIILAFLERQGEPIAAVSRACVLAREMIEIVRGYNRLLERAGLPALEIGVGISFQDSAPMYLLDGEDRIMISDALNESDRLASCNKRMRKCLAQAENPFNVYTFMGAPAADAGENPDEFLMNYNVSGVRLSEAAFRRLGQEIQLEPCRAELPQLWGTEDYRLHAGLVPVGNDIFRKIVVRASRMPQIDARDFSLTTWTDRWYYEVCTNPAVYSSGDAKAAAGSN